MGPSTRLSWLAVVVAVLGCTGCRKPESSIAPIPSTSVASAVASAGASVSASAVPEKSRPSVLAGVWSGSYQAVHHPVTMDKKEAFTGWAKDDKQVGVGPGKLDLTIDANDGVAGTSSGSLGDLVVTGRVEEGTLSVVLLPRDPTAEGAFHGFVLATVEGSDMKGHVAVSNGDGAVVREAAVELKKAK